MLTEADKFKGVLAQSSIPVIWREGGPDGKTLIRLPYSHDNKIWLLNGRKNYAKFNYNEKTWCVPKSWFNDLVNRSLSRYGRVYIIQPYKFMEKCARACRDATGHECECSCMGVNHGSNNHSSWIDVSESFSFRWTNGAFACRMLSRK